jgi:hypothetical protein
MGVPLLNIAAGGVPFPGNKLPPEAINPVARNVVNLYPLGNVSPSIYRATLVGRNVTDQAGGRLDIHASSTDQVFARYSYSGGYNINPISVRGTDVPGFPTRDDLSTHSVVLSNNHVFSPAVINSLRGQTPPSALGFGYESSNDVGEGPPFFNVSGYTPIGGAITGPRNSTQQTLELQNALSWSLGSHTIRMGGGYQRTSIDMFQAIAPNAFYVFAGTFPTNNAVANLLLGSPVTFYQGLGDFGRELRVWGASVYAQDEWRATRKLTLNYGLRYERINPITEAQSRMTGFIPGARSTVLAGENDLAQNPFDVHAEYGPSLFAARHRFVASAIWEPPVPSSASSTVRIIFDNWQLSGIATINSGTPFTVSDSTNVSLQANSPPISGFAASRPNVVGNPNDGPHTVNEWTSRSAFERLNPLTQAGQFGNAGRNIVRGPGYASVDVSLVRNIRFTSDVRLELRVESFNLTNHTNFGLPVADLNSANFGKILSAGPPRLMQFAAKLVF